MRFELRPGQGELALYGAAYRMTTDAYVVVGREGRAYSVELRPKGKATVETLKTLAHGFEAALADEAFHAGLDAGPIRLQILRRLEAIHAARKKAPEPGAKGSKLPSEQAAKLRELLAEEDEGDPRGIAKPWVEQRKR